MAGLVKTHFLLGEGEIALKLSPIPGDNSVLYEMERMVMMTVTIILQFSYKKFSHTKLFLPKRVWRKNLVGLIIQAIKGFMSCQTTLLMTVHLCNFYIIGVVSSFPRAYTRDLNLLKINGSLYPNLIQL